MTNHANRPSLSVVLAACRAERIKSGTQRDGTGAARINVVLDILEAMAVACRDLSSPRYLKIDAERHAARVTRCFAEVHDRAAHGNLVSDDYEAQLAALRSLHSA